MMRYDSRTLVVQTDRYDLNSPSLQAVVKSAALAYGCASAAFFVGPWNDMRVGASFGPYEPIVPSHENDFIAKIASLDPAQILSAQDLKGPHANNRFDSALVSPPRKGEEKSAFLRRRSAYGRTSPKVEPEPTKSDCDLFAGPIRFIVAFPVADRLGTVLGALVLGDTRPHMATTPEKTFVLQTHAAQLAALFLLHALRDRVQEKQAHVVDTTERLRLLESVVVNANDSILITEAEPFVSPGPRIVYCNKAFEKTTGYTQAEVLGKTPRMLQSKNTDRTALAKLKAALERWEPVEVELLNCRKDGTEYWNELSIVPVANEAGWYTHWVSVQRDVSDRKRSQEIATRVRIAESENRALAAEIKERKRVEAQLLFDAYHDRLTKLHNRAFFTDRLEIALDKGQRHAEIRNTVLFLDFDGFKLVNDSLGHLAGDLFLIEAATRLKTCIGPEAVLARVGGDEFAVLLEGDGLGAGIQLAMRIGEVLRPPITVLDQRVFPSCSVGIVESEQSVLPVDFLRNADIAMFEAKKKGAGGYAVFSEAMHADAKAKLALQTDLRQAIKNDEFRLFFQPICDVATSQITGVEALIRWFHPTRGIVAPLTFIPVAEEIGVIREIGSWVLREACRQLAVWSERFGSLNLLMNVNVSGDELLDDHYVTRLNALLQEMSLAPAQLQLEITESVLLHQPDAIGPILKEIRALGIRIALDDFGTGYSSLSYINEFEIDCIKIDRSFVGMMQTQRRTSAIIQTIIALGTGLGLQIVAEGVELDEQLASLRALGCARAQGYLFSKPLSATAMTAALASAHAGTNVEAQASHVEFHAAVNESVFAL